MWIFNTVKFKILEIFILWLWYKEYSQEGSHIKYKFWTKSLIIPKHKEISRWTINNIFKIISIHTKKDKKEIEMNFIEYYTKLKK
jgi:predicted RNA binding protein YcfA (HicA-like mRNA interferase family)